MISSLLAWLWILNSSFLKYVIWTILIIVCAFFCKLSIWCNPHYSGEGKNQQWITPTTSNPKMILSYSKNLPTTEKWMMIQKIIQQTCLLKDGGCLMNIMLHSCWVCSIALASWDQRSQCHCCVFWLLKLRRVDADFVVRKKFSR